MARIIGGQGKGRRLKAPKGLATRPTGARVRQTLFDILAPWLPGCRFLDAFAGAGAVGLEALSRGAALVVLVDAAADAVAAMRTNASMLANTGGRVRIVRQDARVALAAFADAQERFDVVYLDPPYQSDVYEASLEQAGRRGLLAEHGVVVAEHFHKRALPERIGGLTRSREVRVGDHRLSFYRRQQESAPPQS
ncbi:MAG: 16S rRNA (guanine(966)-N(2))-methyltransferase RsmD [Acidobacteria bacterium]|nr:MAG: 16S rRNA (guanine(966)-N(2))-methyltransferase RsmD [Acidobacteriota bacterium]